MKLAITVTVKAMDIQRWICLTQLLQFMCPPLGRARSGSGTYHIHSRLWSRLRHLVALLNAELLGVLRVQPLPAPELQGIGADHAADGISAEKVIQNIEADVPPRGTHGDEGARDAGPEGQARAAAEGFELPSDIIADR